MLLTAFCTLSIAALTLDMPSYEVVDVQRREAFAGKLGYRVDETLTLKSDDKTFHVKLYREHSRFGKTASAFQKGDRVMLSIHGQPQAWMTLERSQVKKS